MPPFDLAVVGFVASAFILFGIVLAAASMYQQSGAERKPDRQR